MTDYMGDMSNPGTLVIKEEAVGFYIGGYTDWVWTEQQIKRQTARYLHPIWVYNPNNTGENSGIVDGHKAVLQCKALGVPAGVTISFDMETSVDPAYLNGVHSVVAPSGYWTGVYGSKDYIVQNPTFGGGRWVADWTGQSHLSGVDGEWACQYAQADSANNSNPWDLSVIKDVSHLWDVQGIAVENGVLVRIPTGVTRSVRSLNGGTTWE